CGTESTTGRGSREGLRPPTPGLRLLVVGEGGTVKPRILNVRKVPAQRWSKGKRFGFEIRWAGEKLDSCKLGFNVTRVLPGRAAWPYHFHHANEEMFFVLEGRGSIRIGRRKYRIREGDFISLPPGRESAHQIVNDSKAPLRYLAVSTMEAPEIAEYPE